MIPKSIISGSFRNPLYGNGADPWLTYFEGNYYLSTTTWSSQLSMRKSPTLAGLSTAEPVYVWSDTEPSRCCQFWAFEFHRLKGPNGYRWYMMYTAGNKNDLNGQKLHVLESAADDPMGPFAFKRTLLPNRWNIDGTYLEHNNRLYLLWSEWFSGDQSMWIAQMSDPWTVNTQTIKLLARPTYNWEQWNNEHINEAPEILKHNGRTFMSFSAAPCHTPEYKLGLMELTGSDPLNPSHWVKDAQPVFQQGNGVFGSGHNGFFKSPNGEQDWLVYHGNAAANQGCGNTRSVRAQPITWGSNGKPQFGQPVSTNTQVNVPAGEAGPIIADVQGIAYQLRNATTGQCATIGSDGYLKQDKCSNIQDAWTLDPTFDGYYRLGHKNTGEFLSVRDCQTANGGLANLSPWYTNGCQQWSVSQNNTGKLTLNHRITKQALGLSQCGNNASIALSSQCNQWQLEPKEAFAVVSLVSGKVLDIGECSTASGALTQQWEWLNSPCQMWQAQPVDGGFVQLKPTHNSSSCLEYVAGAATLIQGSCSSQNSHWRIDPLAKGAVRILSRTSNKVLDVASCGLANGTAIGAYDWLDNECQKFFLRSVQ